MKNPKVDSV